MKPPKFILKSNLELTRFVLQKDGEKWEEEFESIHRAVMFARLLPNSSGLPIVILSSCGIELARMTA
jgi:hypothetical protein